MDESDVVISLLSLPTNLCRLRQLESALGCLEQMENVEDDDHGRYSQQLNATITLLFPVSWPTPTLPR